eukprot:11091666-Lingulodinium_polyedra.AAC.1
MGSDMLSVNTRSYRALGDKTFHSSCDCTVRCQYASAAALPHSVVTLHGMSPACCLLWVARRTSRA